MTPEGRVADDIRVDDDDQLELNDLLSRVLDKGVVIVGEVTLAVANVDLVRLKLNVMLGAVETELQRARRDAIREAADADIPLLRSDAGE